MGLRSQADVERVMTGVWGLSRGDTVLLLTHLQLARLTPGTRISQEFIPQQGVCFHVDLALQTQCRHFKRLLFSFWELFFW